MIKANFVTLLVCSVICLVGGILSPAAAATRLKAQKAVPNMVLMSADQLPSEINEDLPFSVTALLSRSTNLYDFQNGSRKDGIDYLFIPVYKVGFGSFSSKITYSQDLRDQSAGKSDWADVSVTYAMNPNQWAWSNPYILTLTPTLSTVIPTSQLSYKKDQLQTALVAGVSFGIIPDGIAPKKDGAWNLAIGVTVGRAFHKFAEDINGAVLNKYLSNQTLNLGYTYKDFSISTEYIHKSRWTYQDTSKDSFEFSQELGYTITEHFAIAIGHTNAGTGLRANGTESNISLLNENDSTVYGQLAVSF